MPPVSSNRSHLCDSHREEVASSLTHGLGVVHSIAALVVMILLSMGNGWKLASAIVFGTSLVLLYGSSTLYHFITSHAWKQRLQAVDHACIYLLIAGSYTPVTLITLRGTAGWWLFGLVWGIAIAGVLIKLVGTKRRDHWLSTTLYVVMGWLILPFVGQLIHGLSAAGVAWLVAGGVSYTAGIIFFAWRRLPFNHAIWHLFVMAGSACHVLAVSRYVLA